LNSIYLFKTAGDKPAGVFLSLHQKKEKQKKSA
jgi:hypothetical protein